MCPVVCTDFSVPKGQESQSLMVMDMGQHVVHEYAQPLTLYQVMLPGLEDRAFPNLSTAGQLSPGEHMALFSTVCNCCCDGQQV